MQVACWFRFVSKYGWSWITTRRFRLVIDKKCVAGNPEKAQIIITKPTEFKEPVFARMPCYIQTAIYYAQLLAVFIVI